MTPRDEPGPLEFQAGQAQPPDVALPSGNDEPQPPPPFEGSPEVFRNASVAEEASPVVEVYEDGVLLSKVDLRDLEEERARLRKVVDNRSWVLLTPTDWYVVRAAEAILEPGQPTKPVPQPVWDFRRAVRFLAADLDTLLAAATSLEQLDAIDLAPLLNFDPYAQSGA